MEASSASSFPFWVLGMGVVFGLSPPLNHPSGERSKAAHSPVLRKKNTFIHSINASQHQLHVHAHAGPCEGQEPRLG